MSLTFRPPHIPKDLFGNSPDYAPQWSSITRSLSSLDQRLTRGGQLASMLDEIRSALESESNDPLKRALQKRPAHARRAALVLWAEDRALAEHTMSPLRIDLVCSRDHPMSRMALRELLSLYWQYFTSMPSWRTNMRPQIEVLLWHHLDQLVRQRTIRGTLQRVHSASDLVLGDQAPQELSEAATTTHMTLSDFMRVNELTDIRSTEFGENVIRVHYLRQIENADPATSPAFLEELRGEAGLESLMGDGRFFGHHVVEAMAKHGSVPSDDWLQTILHIAGDPRLKNTPSWAKWWQPILDTTRHRVVQWLSRMDLKLFMEAFERFAEEAELEDTQRMFKDRRVFIEGLLETGLIQETRLFLGHAAHIEIRHLVGTELSDSITRIIGNPSETGDKAVVAIDCGDFQLLEGSHNFQLWVYVTERPDGLFTRTASQEMPWKTLKEFAKKDDRPGHEGRARRRGFRHRGTTWQYNAVRYLHDYGHQLQLSKLMSKASYSDYVRLHGVPAELR